MCGITSAVGKINIVPNILDGLRRLEYRGYDSTGIAYTKGDNLEVVKQTGKVASLIAEINLEETSSTVAIGHTRWATHGKPSAENAHPHLVNDVAIVHNGIIENAKQLKEQLLKKGYSFKSATDSEVIAALLDDLCQQKTILEAVFEVVGMLEGSYAFAAVNKKQADKIVAARKGSPLIVGASPFANYLGSDVQALPVDVTDVAYLEEGDFVEITKDEINIYSAEQEKINREFFAANNKYSLASKGKHRHFMQKEIFEQPQALLNCLAGRVHDDHIYEEIYGRDAKEIFSKTKHVQLVACGTSYYAAMVAKYWLEEIANISASVEIASEFRYRQRVVPLDSLFVTLSQSGETADTLAALRSAKEANSYCATMTICNNPESSLVRESDLVCLTQAGPEIGVASTKSFTAQLISLMLLTLVIAKNRGANLSLINDLITDLKVIPNKVTQVLNGESSIHALGKKLKSKEHALFLGRNSLYPIALEGALKLKEITYIYAEAYPAGELKHGPLALVDSNMPIIVLAPKDDLWKKMHINIEEVQARGGEVVLFTSADNKIDNFKGQVIHMPDCSKWMQPILYAIPLQLLAYYTAFERGTDIDNPRNLAKSVTVE